MIDTSFIDTSSIPDYTGVVDVKHERGNTRDIINVVLKVNTENDSRFNKFSRQFPPTLAGLHLLWAWVRNNIKYIEDGFGYQYIKLPEALFGIGKGDCKSFTLFVNQVLKCIGLSYYTRFAGYEGEDFTHVYTVVLLNGKEVPLDAVYNRFSKEVKYTKKEDHMTNIAVIRGIPKNIKTVGNAPTSLEEVQQRKAYIPEQAPINFHKNSYSTSHLLLLKQRLQIFGSMRGGIESSINKAVNMVDGAIKNGYLKEGIIDDSLQKVAAQVTLLLGQPGDSMGYGGRGQKKAFLQAKAGTELAKSKIGSSLKLKDLGSLFYKQIGGTGAPTDPFQFEPLVKLLPNGDVDPFKLVTTTQIQNNPNALLFWGRDTFEYQVPLSDFWNDYQKTKQDFIQAHPGKMAKQDKVSERYAFANQASYDLFLEEIKANSGVLSKWINELFRVKKKGVNNANPASGTLYNFLNTVNGATYNDFPEKVRFKGLSQQGYIAACVDFSGVARSLVEAMLINGVMADMGGHEPKAVLEALLHGSKPGIGIIDPATLAVIATIATTLLTTAGGIITVAMNNGANKAAMLDQSMKDSAQFANQNASTIPHELDFAAPVAPPNGSGGGGGGSDPSGSGDDVATSGGSTLLKILGVGAAGYLLTRGNATEEDI
ncbi:MAG: hypothetical protein ACRBFS_19360 [Aureispira sp.]